MTIVIASDSKIMGDFFLFWTFVFSHFSILCAMSRHYFVMRKKESKILRKLLHAFLAWVRSWIFMFKLVSRNTGVVSRQPAWEIMFLSIVAGVCVSVSKKMDSKMNVCESRLLWGKTSFVTEAWSFMTSETHRDPVVFFFPWPMSAWF